MKQEINLLPRAVQHSRLRRLYLVHGGRLLNRIYVSLLVVVVAQTGMFIILSRIASEGADGGLRLSDEARNVQREVRRTNGLLVAFNERVEQQVIWTDLLDNVLDAIASPVVLTELLVAEDTRVLVLRGTSPSQAAVIDLQQRLEGLPWVTRVEAPLQNFTVGPDAEFSLSLYRK